MIIEHLSTRIRCIDALLVREAKKRFGNGLSGMTMAFFEPLVQVAFFSALYYLTGRQGPHGISPFAFMITGVLPYHLFSKTLTKAMSGIDANKTLLSYPILKPIDTILSRVILEVLIYLLVFVVLIMICVHEDLIDAIHRPFYFVMGITSAILMATGGAIFFAALLSFIEKAKMIVPILMRVGFMTSGVFFSMSMLPQVARDIVIWNPMMNVTEMIRYSLFVDYSDAYFSLSFVMMVNFILITLGLSFLEYAQRHPKAKIRNT